MKAKKAAAPKKEAAKKAPAKKAAAPKKEAAPKKVKATQSGAVDRALYDVIERPIITEKSTRQLEMNKVVFKISPNATKTDVKRAVEKLFKVTVTKVNTINVQGKEKRFKNALGKRQDYRKAIVTLAEGQSIDLAAGLR